MFEAAETGRTISKEQYQHAIVPLRQQLLDAQFSLRDAHTPVIVVFAGVDGAGKSETVHLLNEWMDPRWIMVRAYGPPTEEERARPHFWRFWRDLPPKGRLGLFLSSWYSQPTLDRVYRRITRAELDAELDRIAAFERMLTDDGAIILKFWMHLNKAQQKKRLRALEKSPLTRWRVTPRQWKHWERYDRFIATAEDLIRRTSVGAAPWTIVEGRDWRYRSLAVATAVRDAMHGVIKASATRPASAAARPPATRRRQAPAVPTTLVTEIERRRSVLASLKMTQTLGRRAYDVALEKQQGRLSVLHRGAVRAGVSTIVVFEGWGAAGNGGAIRRVSAALEPHWVDIMATAAPSDEERAHHYLWRFWRRLPRPGGVVIFDHSWYGRVLVDRVEGLASPDAWRRAYAEINQFEAQLVHHGIVLIKFWMHITKDEQLRRFRERANSRLKNWKLSQDDWRNREKWDAYELAVNDMVERTSTRATPWTLVEGNDKYFARIKTLRTCGDAIEKALG